MGTTLPENHARDGAGGVGGFFAERGDGFESGERHESKNQRELKTGEVHAFEMNLRWIHPGARVQHGERDDGNHHGERGEFQSEHDFGGEFDIAKGDPPREEDHDHGKNCAAQIRC